MRRSKQDNTKEIFNRAFVLPSEEQTALSCGQVLRRLKAGEGNASQPRSATTKQHQDSVAPLGVVHSAQPWWQLAIVRAAVAVAIVALVSVLLFRTLVFPENVYATVETLDGPLYRVSGGERHPINVGDRIDIGKVLRTDTSSGAVLALSDGSRVEMREETELSVERAKDGVQIRLNEGSVLVIPAEKPKGALYVQSAEGTQPVTAMVFQSVPASTSIGAKSAGGTEQARLRFEVVSLRPVSQTPSVGSADRLFRCRGVDGVFHASTGALFNLATLAGELDALPPSSAVPLGRCVGLVHPRQLIAQAYNIPNPPMQVSSSFDWPETYQIEAKAADPASVTKAQLREMLQSLLAERYAFKMHLESREGPGCILRVARNGPKFKATSLEETVEPPRLATGPGPMTFKGKFRMKTFASSLWMLAGRVSVIDQTGLPDVYDLTFRIDPDGLGGGGGGGGRGGGGADRRSCNPNLSRMLEDQLGLVLQSANVPTDYLVVEHIEKPTED